jgi:hypothetical protein
MEFEFLTTSAPFWAGFTAFCANEIALFALDKLSAVTLRNFWLATVGSLFVGGAVYGKEKLAEIKRDREK